MKLYLKKDPDETISKIIRLRSVIWKAALNQKKKSLRHAGNTLSVQNIGFKIFVSDNQPVIFAFVLYLENLKSLID